MNTISGNFFWLVAFMLIITVSSIGLAVGHSYPEMVSKVITSLGFIKFL